MGVVASVIGAVAAIGTVASAGAGIYGMLTRPGAPSVGPAPMPANYYSYDEEGNLEGSQEWDQKKNAYIYKAAPLTEEEKADKEVRNRLKDQYIKNLSEAPEDRIKAYEDYSKAYSDAMHKETDYQYGKVTQAKTEEAAARGMLGSRAYVDTQAALTREKMESDVDIANRAVIAKEALKDKDRQFWYQGYTGLEAGDTAKAALALQKANMASQVANQGTAATLGAYNAYNVARMQQWQTELAQSNLQSKQMMDTATGLGFLYGFMGKGGGSGSGKSSSEYNFSVANPDLTPDIGKAYRQWRPTL